VAQDHVVTAWDYLSGHKRPAGRRVVVIGGFLVGCETAEYAAMNGAEVTMVSRSPRRRLGGDMSLVNRRSLIRRLREMNVTFINEHDVVSIREHDVELAELATGTRKTIPADTVILARGAQKMNDLALSCATAVREVHTVGDADSPGDFTNAIRSGFDVGSVV
jgi:NADPH-dependent 2,4-dienoyl-CoA reductase/sulfur reductase-like enzyme